MSAENGTAEMEHAQEIGKLKSEVHTLNTLVTKLFDKFDQFTKDTSPKRLGASGILGIATSILAIFAILFGSVIYITNSSNAPISAQMNQMTQVLATIQSNTMQNASQGQLLSKELSGLRRGMDSNEATLEWLLFRENLPKQVTEAQGRLNTLEMQVARMVNEIHNKGDQ